MKRAKWMVLAVAAGALVAEFGMSNFNAAEAGPAARVIICHNTGNGNITIEVSGNAVGKHFTEHGDVPGACFRPI